MKTIRAILLVLLLGITPLFGISVQKAAAAGQIYQTWTGTAGDGKMSTAGNWAANEVPDNGDVLQLPAGFSDETIQADLGSGVILSRVLIGTTGSGAFDYTINGAIRTASIESVGDGTVDLNAGVSLYDVDGVETTGINASTDSLISLNSFIVYQDVEHAYFTGPGVIVIDTADMTGPVGEVTFQNSKEDEGGGIFFLGLTSSQPDVYTLDNVDMAIQQDSLRPTDEIIVENDSRLFLHTEQPYTANKISLGTGSEIYGSVDGILEESEAEHDVVTISGDVEFLDTVPYDGRGNDLKLTGNLSGNGTMVPTAGSVGNIIVELAAGKTNSSKLANGVTKPAVKTTTYTDSNTDVVDVFENNTVIVNGSRGATTVYPGGILKGSGTVGILDVKSGGTVAPGQSPGCLTAGNTTFSAGSTFEAEIAGKTVCTEYDQLKVTGTVSLGGATLNTKLINDFKPQTNDAFTILDNDGTDVITGTFKDLAEGATFTVDGYVFKITYKGGDGNDVTVTVQTVPATPNTGMQLLTASPLLTLVLTTISAGALFTIARRYSLVSKNK